MEGGMGLIPTEGGSKSVHECGLGFMRPRHREIARRIVLGTPQHIICDTMGISSSRLSIIINSKLFQDELSRLENMREDGVRDITKTLQELQPVALAVVEHTMYNGTTERMRFEAAESILDRGSTPKTTKSKVDIGVDVHISHYERVKQELLELEKVVTAEGTTYSISETDCSDLPTDGSSFPESNLGGGI
jgi:hypothetical protein